MEDMQKHQYEAAAQKLAEALKAVEAQAKALADQIQQASQDQVDALKQAQQLADQVQKLDALQEKVADIKAEQAAAMDPQGQMSPQDQQKLDSAMAEAAQEMKADGQQQAAQEMGQAQQDTQKGQNDQAKQDLNQAQQDLAQAMQQTQDALAQAEQKIQNGPGMPDPGHKPQPAQAQQPPQPPQPPQPATEPPTEIHEEKGTPVGEAAVKAKSAESTWRAKLPDSERQALLSARKEAYAPQMEQDVKKYYELLAE